jgi:hypothetical protein
VKIDDIAPQRTWNEYRKRFEDQHAVIFGCTRYGKTYLVERLVGLRKWVAIHDPKAEYALRGFRIFDSIDKLIRATDTASKTLKTPRVIYAPNVRELRDPGAQNAFFAWGYDRGNTQIIADELNALTTGRADMPPAMLDCYARGNGRGVAIVGLTQEPVYVPGVAMTQASHRYTFYVANLDHQKKVCSFMPGLSPEAIDVLPKRYFYYFALGEKGCEGPFVLGADQVRGAA